MDSCLECTMQNYPGNWGNSHLGPFYIFNSFLHHLFVYLVKAFKKKICWEVCPCITAGEAMWMISIEWKMQYERSLVFKDIAECKILANGTLECHVHSSKSKWRCFKRKILFKNPNKTHYSLFGMFLILSSLNNIGSCEEVFKPIILTLYYPF